MTLKTLERKPHYEISKKVVLIDQRELTSAQVKTLETEGFIVTLDYSFDDSNFYSVYAMAYTWQHA